jgi:hypothetical protein
MKKDEQANDILRWCDRVSGLVLFIEEDARTMKTPTGIELRNRVSRGII